MCIVPRLISCTVPALLSAYGKQFGWRGRRVKRGLFFLRADYRARQPLFKAHLWPPAYPLLKLGGIHRQPANAGLAIWPKLERAGKSQTSQHRARVIQGCALTAWATTNIEDFPHNQGGICVQEHI